MNQITDAVLLTSSMKILNRKARYIKEKLNLTEINIDWKVLEEKIYFSQKSYQSPIVLGENEVGYVKLNPNEAVISSSIITAPSPIDITASSIMKYVKSAERITRKEAENILSLKKTQTVQILTEMVDKGLLLKVGAGRNTNYAANV